MRFLGISYGMYRTKSRCKKAAKRFSPLHPGLLAKNAVEAGLSVAPYIKTSLSPGSGVVTYYLRESGVQPALTALGFDTVGFGCMTCIGNSGPLPESVTNAIESVGSGRMVWGKRNAWKYNNKGHTWT